MPNIDACQIDSPASNPMAKKARPRPKASTTMTRLREVTSFSSGERNFCAALRQSRDLAELGVRARGEDDGDAVTGKHGRAGKQGVGAAQDIRCIGWGGGTVDRHRLAGHRGIADTQYERLDQTAIRRHHVTLPQQDDIPRHQFRVISEEVLESLRTSGAGLSSKEAARRLAEYGPNAVERIRGKPLHKRAIETLTHLLALLLWFAAAIAFIGHTFIGKTPEGPERGLPRANLWPALSPTSPPRHDASAAQG